MNAWEESTIKQYNSALALWWKFNIEENSDLFDVTVSKALKFLAKRYQEGANHGTLNSSRSALAAIAVEDIGNNELIKRFIKGSSKTRPSKPKYDSTWDVDPVLNKLQSWFPLEALTLKQLSQKLALLLALRTAHRLQTLVLIKIPNRTKCDKGLEIKIPDRIKSTGTSKMRQVLRLPFFSEKPEFCIARTLLRYLEIIKNLRNGEDHLLISFQKPHRRIKENSLGRWIRTTLVSLGVDKKFTAHSTRHASTSKAFEKGVSIEEIKRVVGWSPSSRIFENFYNRPVIGREDTFASTVLLPKY